MQHSCLDYTSILIQNFNLAKSIKLLIPCLLVYKKSRERAGRGKRACGKATDEPRREKLRKYLRFHQDKRPIHKHCGSMTLQNFGFIIFETFSYPNLIFSDYYIVQSKEQLQGDYFSNMFHAEK